MKNARILVLLCLVIALAVGLAVSAGAVEPQTIDRIDITMAYPQEGNAIPEGPIDPSEYSVILMHQTSESSWDHVNDAIESIALTWQAAGTFTYDQPVDLQVDIQLKDGYRFVGSVEFWFNGDIMGAEAVDSDSISSSINVEVLPIPRTDVMVPELPQAVPGATADAYSYTDEMNIEPRFQITGTWGVYNDATNTVESFTGTFESGKLYLLNLEVAATSGYKLWDAYALVDQSTDQWYHSNDYTDTTMKVSVPRPAGEVEMVDNIYVSGIPTQITAGQTAGAVTLVVDPTAFGDNATVTAQWLDAEGNPFTGTFETGKVYYLSLTATPKAGYLFRERVWLADKETEKGTGLQASGITASGTIRYSLVPKVEKVEISGVTAPVVGQAPTTTGIAVPSGAKYALNSEHTNWENLTNYEAWTVFENGNKYELRLCVEVADGYEFSEDMIVTLGGVELERDCWSSGDVEGKPCLWISLEYSFLTVIEKVDITGVTVPVIGAAPTLEGIQVTTGVIIDPYNSGWSDVTTGSWSEVEGNFQNYHKYILQISLEAAKGYEFAEDLQITLNGVALEEMDNASYGGGSEFGWLNVRYSFVTEVDRLDVTGMTAPAVGQTATTQGITCDAADIVAKWYDEEGNEFTGTFEAGKAYYLYLDPTMKAGYELINARLFINGQRAMEYYGDNGVTFYVRYSFKTVTSKVEITGATAAVIGQTATVEGIQITGAKLDEAFWVDADADAVFTGIFADSKKYYLIISFEAGEGCEFDENTVVTLNGVELDEDSFYPGSDTQGQAIMLCNFKKQIAKVELTGMPQFTVGGTIAADMKAPEGANYEVQAMWDSENGEATGTFKNNETYILYIVLSPKDGYEFAEDLQIFIDGKEADTNLRISDAGDIALGYIYNASLTVLDKLEITVTEPAIGVEIKDDLVKVPENAGYKVDAYWYVSEDGKRWEEASGVFEAGKYYAVDLTFEIDGETYMLANNAKLIVNGSVIKVTDGNGYIGPQYGYVMVEFGKLCAHTYGDWTSVDGNNHSKTCSKCGDVLTEGHAWHGEGDVKCSECGYEREINPPTGDMIVSACLLALCSATALVVIKRRKF